MQIYYGQIAVYLVYSLQYFLAIFWLYIRVYQVSCLSLMCFNNQSAVCSLVFRSLLNHCAPLGISIVLRRLLSSTNACVRCLNSFAATVSQSRTMPGLTFTHAALDRRYKGDKSPIRWWEWMSWRQLHMYMHAHAHTHIHMHNNACLSVAISLSDLSLLSPLYTPFWTHPRLRTHFFCGIDQL